MPVASHLAAALIGLAAGYWILLGAVQSDSLSRELVAALVRSLMAAQPFDVASGDPHRVGPWFAGKLDFAPKVRDLAAQGFPLVGGQGRLFRRPQSGGDRVMPPRSRDQRVHHASR
jgi:anti-sigma factor RsiW